MYDKPMNMPKRVTIEEADNGFMVSCYTDDGEKKIVAKSKDELVKAVMKMFGKRFKSTSEIGDRVVSRMK